MTFKNDIETDCKEEQECVQFDSINRGERPGNELDEWNAYLQEIT